MLSLIFHIKSFNFCYIRKVFSQCEVYSLIYAISSYILVLTWPISHLSSHHQKECLSIMLNRSCAATYLLLDHAQVAQAKTVIWHQ